MATETRKRQSAQVRGNSEKNTTQETPSSLENEEALSIEDKLAVIDNEIRDLHQFCLNNGYTPAEIQKRAGPLLSPAKQFQRRKWLGRLAVLVAVVTVAAALVYFDPAYKLICVWAKLSSMKVLPYWDWTQLYTEDCILRNPYYIGNRLLEEDCEVCEALQPNIIRLQNVSHELMSDNYLQRDTPIIVTDAMSDWPAMQQFSVEFLAKLYNEDPGLTQVLPCMFGSNLRLKRPNVKGLLQKAASGELTNWHARWENCERQAAKALRQFYNRPYFLPPMVETLTESNWVVISSDYKGTKYREAPFDLPLMWIGQLKGKTNLHLVPREPCNATCPELWETLNEGEMVVITDLMWKTEYLLSDDGENIAIAAGGLFD